MPVPGPMRVVVYRRLMLRIAERIARMRGAQALVTGDVVGQVASQTLENLAVIGSVASLPLFRPLIGMDKDEITAEAQRIGTYPISIIPDQDCCTLFTPRNPQTRARLADIERPSGAADRRAGRAGGPGGGRGRVRIPAGGKGCGEARRSLKLRPSHPAATSGVGGPVVGSRTEVQSGFSQRD